MNPYSNRAVFLPGSEPEAQSRQATPTRQARTAPPAPLPGPASHPFTRKIQAFIDAGKTRGAAIRAAIASDPAGHQSWIAAVQRHGQ